MCLKTNNIAMGNAFVTTAANNRTLCGRVVMGDPWPLASVYEPKHLYVHPPLPYQRLQHL